MDKDKEREEKIPLSHRFPAGRLKGMDFQVPVGGIFAI